MNLTNIIIAASLLLNSILLMAVVGIVPFLLFLSIVCNVALMIFIKKLLDEQEEIGLDSSQLFDSLEKFERHLQGIYELETFYGDSTLSGLIDHMRVLADDMEEYCKKHEFITIQEEMLIAAEEDIEKAEE